MEENIKMLFDRVDILKKYYDYPREELEIMRMYINMGLVEINRQVGSGTSVRLIKTCLKNSYDYLDYIISFKNRLFIDNNSTEDEISTIEKFNNCSFCKCKNCIKKSLAIFMDEIDKYNFQKPNKIPYIEVIDYLLDRKNPEFKMIPEKDFFSSVDVMELIKVQVILESDLIYISNLDEENNIAEFNYLDLSEKSNNEYYINILVDYYKKKKQCKNLKINLNNIDEIFKEKDEKIRVYKIAAYYKYLIEVKKIDIIIKLREILELDKRDNDINIRSRYFIHKYFEKVEQLPYSKKTKDKIYNILNYILNYRFKMSTPFIPINILIYSNDKEGIEKICNIIGEFMWFFGYLPEDMKYYSEYVNNIILDKFNVKKIYEDKEKKKKGILILHNFENILYTNHMQQNLILNILTDEMEKNNKSVCTIIYGERETLKKIMGNHYKLSQMLINFELEIDNLNMDKIYEMIIEKLEEKVNVSEPVKEKIYNYINATYRQSNTQNMEYVKKLYNRIILNMNNKFSVRKTQELSITDIPEAYNTKDLPEIMKDINSLVGLADIKEQINDLVALLKFNKKANININNFNLHMVFSGNPGTGKTTVARLLKDIFFNLGYINQNKIVEVTAKDLIAEYLGQTSGKTYSVVKSALGGVLFIDEAYAITTDGTSKGNQYGNECIATLLKLMEDYKDKLIIIFAGYEKEMESFQFSNPGLVSRIGYKIKFPNFTLDEMEQIYLNLLETNKLTIDEDALEKLKSIIEKSSESKDFGNARYINTVFQKVLIEHSKNIEKNNQKNNLYQIKLNDINYEKLIVDNKTNKIGF